MWSPIEMHSATEATGITHFAPLCKAAVMVDVARKISMITTTAPAVSYKCSKAGDKHTSSPGLSIFRTRKIVLQDKKDITQ